MGGDFRVWDPAYRHLSDPSLTPEEERAALDMTLKSYQATDRWLDSILQAVPDDAVVLIASDHGVVPIHTTISINAALIEAGLLAVVERDGELVPDWAKTRAYHNWKTYVSVNLEGEYPDGCVSPDEYEAVRNQIIPLVTGLRDPLLGEPNVVAAWRKEETAAMGYGGDRVGDVVIAAKPGYCCEASAPLSLPVRIRGRGGMHGRYLPTIQDVMGAFFAIGPGVRSGELLDRPVRSVDIAPTISHLLGIPAPRAHEGCDVLGRLGVISCIIAQKSLQRHAGILRYSLEQPS